jgi:hypothetical protein
MDFLNTDQGEARALKPHYIDFVEFQLIQLSRSHLDIEVFYGTMRSERGPAILSLLYSK